MLKTDKNKFIKTDIEQILAQTYDECVNYLKNKYGKVTGDYFLDKECKNINKDIIRKEEGLYIHHIDDDRVIMLSSPKHAAKNSFDFQRADRLVYSNLLEHLVLHMKIFEYPNLEGNKEEAPGIERIYNYIIPELNDIYGGISYHLAWKQKVIEIVIPLKNDYLKCIKKLIELKFPYQLMKSLNEKNGKWKNEYNKDIYDEFNKIGLNQIPYSSK